MRTIVYVDGFNLYYAIRNRGFKWLNLWALSEALLPKTQGYSIQQVRYFTARVSGAADPDQPRRQHIYLNALKTIPGIQVHFGKFLAKSVWRPAMAIPIANRQIVAGSQTVTLPAGDHRVSPDISRADSRSEVMPVGCYPNKGVRQPPPPPAVGPHPEALRLQVHWMEEKGSDVNLACHLVNDAWAGRFDAAAVLSNDTDLVEPIRIVREEIGKQVVLLCPSSRGASRPLEVVASSVRHIHGGHLRSAQFPDQIPGTAIIKPASW